MNSLGVCYENGGGVTKDQAAAVIWYPRRNRRRNRLPMLVLTFILGLLAGWVLRGGGAWLP